MKKWLENIATQIARPPEESRLLGDPMSTRTKMTIFGLLFLALILIFVPATYMQFSQYSDFKIHAPLERKDWKVAYLNVDNYKEVCNPLKEITAKCPAHPEHPFFKDTKFTRADKEHMNRTNSRRNQVIWYYAQLGPEQIKEIIKNDANHLLIGNISGDYEIWVNKKRYLNVELKGLREVVSIPVVSGDFSNDSLHIAIRIQHNSGLVFPDMFVWEHANGFLTIANLKKFELKRLFFGSITTWLLFGIQFTLFLIFFLFWYSAKKKPEYGAMALLLIAYSLQQILFIEYVTNILGGRVYHQLLLLLYYAIPMTIIYLGLSYSRIRRSIISNLVQVIGATALFSFATSFFISVNGITRIYYICYTYIIPSAYLICSLTAMTQTYLLGKFDRQRFATRINRLRTFSLVNFLIFLNFAYHSTQTDFHFFERYILITLVTLLGYVVISEYRDQELIIEKSPLTEYHKHPHIGRIVSGVLFGLDLKKAEKLYLKRAEEGSRQTLVSEWRVAMIQTLKSKGALFLQSKGDEIFAMIDKSKYDSAAIMAALILKDLKKESLDFKRRKLESGELEDPNFNFEFRAAVVKGKLRPVFDTVDGKEYPEWEEAGETMPFVDCGRLMALEKELVAHKNETQVVFEQSVAQDLSKDSMFDRLITYYDQEFRSKAHGKAYKIASLLIDENNLTNQSSTTKAS